MRLVVKNQFPFSWCFCGCVGKPQFLGKCARHASKEPKKKLEKQKRFRGNSKWQSKNGMFKGTIE